MIIPKSLKELVLECGEFDKEHRKYSEFYATWTLECTQEVLDKYTETPDEMVEWHPFVGLTIVANGMWDDSYGSEVHDWSVYREVDAEESEGSKEFWKLMDHLNSEDNDMAHEFARKHFPRQTTLELIKPVLLTNTVPAMSVAKAVSDE